jgi:hypothetical protein
MVVVYRMRLEDGHTSEGIAVKRDKMMKLTAWAAHRAGKLRLPPGYRLKLDADMIQLYRLNGALVATFSARGAAPAEVLRTAEEDYRAHGKSST